MGSTETMRRAILDQLLVIAAFDGWTNASLRQAALLAGYMPEQSLVAFSGGIGDAVDYFSVRANTQMMDQLDKMNRDRMRVRERIAAAVMVRLELYNGHKEAMRRLAAFYSMPHNAVRAACNMEKIVSLMWYAAGDESTDFNYYTKRSLLAGVYTSTMLFWLNDTSENHQKTREFLDRRIADVMKIQTAKAKAQSFINKIPVINRIFV